MEQIKATPDELRDLGREIRTASERLRIETEQIVGLLRDFDEAWEGELGASYAEKARAGLEDLERLQETLDGLSRMLGDASDRYRDSIVQMLSRIPR